VMKIWISKYALTRGIYAVEINRTPVVGIPFLLMSGGLCKSNEWHLTSEAAIERADVMRENKIYALERQIYKLKQMDFTNIGGR
jgi:hypothetical protein